MPAGESIFEWQRLIPQRNWLKEQLSTSDVFKLTGEEGLFGFGHHLDF